MIIANSNNILFLNETKGGDIYRAFLYIPEYISEIIGNPNFELIGRTNGNALNWTIETNIDTNNDLVFTAFGVGTENNSIMPEDDKILWEFDIDIVKV